MTSASELIAYAGAQIGKPYVYGAEGPNQFDCSGLTQYVYKQAGIDLPRTAAQQQAYATPVTTPQPGDLVFWGNPAYHVALYAGDGKVIAAPQEGENVQLQQVWGTPTYGHINGVSAGNWASDMLQGLIPSSVTNLTSGLTSGLTGWIGQIPKWLITGAVTIGAVVLAVAGLWTMTRHRQEAA